jgi:hypothetical protein
MPMRPQGIERNVVITLWDWAGPKDYLHDEISTDRRNPTVNANGLIYGATEESTDLFPILDPVNHKSTQIKMPVRDPKTPSSKGHPLGLSPYWADLEKVRSPKTRKDFKLLTDFSLVDAMEFSVKGEIEKAMDLFNAQGVTEIIRVIPDANMDIGFNLMSASHDSKQIKVHTLRSRQEAEAHFGGKKTD